MAGLVRRVRLVHLDLQRAFELQETQHLPAISDPLVTRNPVALADCIRTVYNSVTISGVRYHPDQIVILTVKAFLRQYRVMLQYKADGWVILNVGEYTEAQMKRS